MTISALTIQNGVAPSGSGAGGLYAGSTNLTLDHVIVQNNSSPISSGGGIKVSGGSLTITDSAILNNSVGSGGSGGGLFYSGGAAVTMTNVTFSGNTADHIGGGFYGDGGGAASLTNVTLTNNTVTNTSNGEGAAFGVWASGTVSLKYVLSAGNMDNGPWNGVDCADLGVSGAVVSQGHNLIGISTGCTLTAQAGDQLGTVSSPINAQIDALADNGGSTYTHALLTGSTAINAGDNSGCPATDQRGFARDATCDVGAYEYGATAFWGGGFANINFRLGANLPQAVDTDTPTPTVSDTPAPTPTASATLAPTATGSPTMMPSPTPQLSGPVTINYVYDPLNRLTEANYSTGDYYHYTYDAVGNRRAQDTSINSQPSTTNYEFDNANRLTSVNSMQYTWDNNGNLLNDGVNAYTYDSANRLIAFSGQQSAISYAYNGLGDRLQETVNGQTTTFAMDLNAGLTQVLDDGTNTYLYGLERIAQVNGANTDYFLGDALGSMRQLADTEGEIALTQAYDPYGNVVTSVGAETTMYGFTNEYANQALIYLRSRTYDPATGRFLSKDSWQGDYYRPLTFNYWSYVEGNPVNRTDPTGYASTSANQGINERDLTWWLSKELVHNANSWYIQKIRALMNTPTNDTDSKERGLDAFKNLVQDRAKWDFKHKILDEMGRSIVLLDNNANMSGWWYEYSVPGNIHYGFVGRAAGIPGWLLHAGAGFAEITDPAHLERDIFGYKIKINPPFCPEGPAGDTCRKYTCPYVNWLWIGSGFDEPRDYNAVETGIQLYDTYGANITFGQLIQGLTTRGQMLDHSGVQPAWNWQNPRGGWPYAVGRFNGPREAEYELIIQIDLR